MRLDPFIRDYRGFLIELVAAIEAQGTLFYLDTSLLMWLLQVAPRARAEFTQWCGTRPGKAVRVPVWAAHELHRHLIDDTVRLSVGKTLRETEAKYDEFVRLAAERADDAKCLANGFAGRASYVGQVEQSLVLLQDFKRVADLDADQLRQAAEEVVAVVNAYVLESDIGAFIHDLSLTGDFRSSHRIPPGFHDKKQENSYGDMIIWEEIIGDLLAAGPDPNGQPRNAVLVSRDKKTDWVSSAPFVRNLRDKPEKSNRDLEFDVTLAHPLLVHELSIRAHGNRIYITPPGFLASTLDFAARQHGQHLDIAQWLAASHRPRLPSRVASIGIATQASPPLPASPTPVATGSEITLEAEDAMGVMSVSVVEELRQYWGTVPLEQPSLFSDWVAQLQQGELAPFQFGRILAELSVSGGAGWSEELPAVVGQLASTTRRELLNAVVLAIIASVYFDRYGKPLRQPRVDIGQIALSLEIDPRLTPAFSALNRFLVSAGARLPYIPGGGRNLVTFTLNLVEGSASKYIRDIRIAGHSAVASPLDPDSPRRLSALLAREPTELCTGQELRMLIAREYLIPSDLLSSAYDRNKLTWSADAGLVTLDTESEAGLSALADEEDEND